MSLFGKLALMLGLACGGTATAGGIDVTARLALDDKSRPAIEFRIRNTSAGPIEMYQADLPWGTVHSTQLVAVEVGRHREPLRPVVPIDGPGPLTVTIKPGGEMTGILRLVQLYPDISRHDRDVAVFWTYEPRSSRAVPVGKRAGGMILVPAKKKP